MLTKRKLIRLGFHSLDQMFVLQTDLWQSCEEEKSLFDRDDTDFFLNDISSRQE
jgi:hypothetical protein